jgi:hypothetical protein
MRSAAAVLLISACVVLAPRDVRAQDPPPRIGPYVLDIRGNVPRFPNNQPLADSRGLTLDELPGAGLGVDLGAHVYLFRWKAVTFGLGGQFTTGRAHTGAVTIPNAPAIRAVTERFTSLSPQLSFNFGSGDGWSYLSGGLGRTRWTVVPDGEPFQHADDERLRSVNYGGGARWFIKPRLAFTFDVRFYDIDPGTPSATRPAAPRARLILMGAGISVR